MSKFSRRDAIKSALVASAALKAGGSDAAFAGELQDFKKYDSRPQDFGIASGEPSEYGFVIWTRAPQQISAHCVGQIRVDWWVRELPEAPEIFGDSVRHQEEFSICASGNHFTDATRDFTVKVSLTDLQPNSRYLYQFSIEGLWQSEVGFARTLPHPDAAVEKLKFAYVSCQYFGMGFYTVFQALAQDELDFCVHLGDSIYESVGPLDHFLQVRPEPQGEARSLEDYRELYKRQLGDKWYREVRRLFTWIYLPDDHEVYNDYSGKEPDQLRRRNDAYQAYFEYTPNAVLAPASDQNVWIFGAHPSFTRSFRLGSLATLFALDLRQFRDLKPKDSAAVSDPRRSILGEQQRNWLLSGLRQSDTLWNVLLSSVMMMPKRLIKRTDDIPASVFETFLHHSPFERDQAILKTAQILYDTLGGGKDFVNNFDAWDGFAYERAEVIDFLAAENQKNTLVWTGDIHNLYGGYLQAGSTNAGFELTTGSVTSPGIGDIFRFGTARLVENHFRSQNRHMKILNFRNHMYVRCTLTPQSALYESVSPHTVRAHSSRHSVTDSLLVLRGSLETKVL